MTKQDLLFMWQLVGGCCFGAALVCTPIIALTGGPWWAGFVYGGYYFVAFGAVGTAAWLISRVFRR